MVCCGLSNPILRFHVCCRLFLLGGFFTGCLLMVFGCFFFQVPTPMARSSIRGLPKRKYQTVMPLMILNKTKFQGNIFHRKRVSNIFQASVVPPPPPPPPLQQDTSDELQRNAMCESYGFTQIGEPLPENVTLKNIIDSLPKKVIYIK